jgi:hypothetical protein
MLSLMLGAPFPYKLELEPWFSWHFYLFWRKSMVDRAVQRLVARAESQSALLMCHEMEKSTFHRGRVKSGWRWLANPTSVICQARALEASPAPCKSYV